MRINIDVTNHCNKACSICPMRDRYHKRYFPMGYMDVALFTNIVDQLPEGTEIDFHKDGEPLLHKDIAWMIGYAHNKGFFTHIVTNGILLDRYKKELIESGLDLITISIVDAIPYHSINSFMQYKGARKPFTQLKMYEDIDVLKLPDADNVIQRKKHNWTNDDKRYTRKPCPKLLHYAAVNWDGGYAICCVDYKREMVPCSIKDIPLSKCLEFSSMLYKWQANGFFLPPCNRCNYSTED